jgi:hypothetical protein
VQIAPIIAPTTAVPPITFTDSLFLLLAATSVIVIPLELSNLSTRRFSLSYPTRLKSTANNAIAEHMPKEKFPETL